MDDELDQAQIKSLRDLDPNAETLRELIGLFESSSMQTLPTLRTALAGKDLMTIKRAAHSLKGSSASLGAVKVAALCKTIEKACMENQTGQLPGLLDQLEARIKSTTAALKAAV